MIILWSIFSILLLTLFMCFPRQRARALAASGPVFSAFTPQSILRSSLRPTPVATPSASPGRSITPPIRSKENRITFIEESESPEVEKGIRWTNGVRKKRHTWNTQNLFFPFVRLQLILAEHVNRGTTWLLFFFLNYLKQEKKKLIVHYDGLINKLCLPIISVFSVDGSRQ